MTHYIYFIKAGIDGPIKIGHSKCNNVKERLIACQIGNHLTLKLLCTMDGTRKDEKRLHAQFAKYNIRGEWFYPNDELLKLINSLPQLNIVSSLDNKKNKHPRWHNAPTKTLQAIRKKREFTLGPCFVCGRKGHDYHFLDGDKNNFDKDNITSSCRRCTMIRDGRLKKLKQASRKIKRHKKTTCSNCNRKCAQIRLNRCRGCYDYIKRHNKERPIEMLDKNGYMKKGRKPKVIKPCIVCTKTKTIQLLSGECHACYERERRKQKANC